MAHLDTRIGPARARLAGKTVIVTGAGSAGDEIGIGKAIALLFAREGARVGVVDLALERAERTAAAIRAAGGEAMAIAANVVDNAACEHAIAAVLEKFGALDILINNVGIAGGGGLDNFDEDQWQRILDTNLKSAILMCRHTMPALIRSGGNVVNIASISGLRAMGAGTAYGPSKAALIMLTRELALTYGRQGVRANVVAPGHIFSPMVETFFTPAMRTARRKVSPLNFEADVWDVALATLFIASDDARFITGVCLPVDGGVTEIGAVAAHQLIND